MFKNLDLSLSLMSWHGVVTWCWGAGKQGTDRWIDADMRPRFPFSLVFGWGTRARQTKGSGEKERNGTESTLTSSSSSSTTTYTPGQGRKQVYRVWLVGRRSGWSGRSSFVVPPRPSICLAFCPWCAVAVAVAVDRQGMVNDDTYACLFGFAF